MRISKYRKVGLASCVLLILAASAPVFQARANNTPTIDPLQLQQQVQAAVAQQQALQAQLQTQLQAVAAVQTQLQNAAQLPAQAQQQLIQQMEAGLASVTQTQTDLRGLAQNAAALQTALGAATGVLPAQLQQDLQTQLAGVTSGLQSVVQIPQIIDTSLLDPVLNNRYVQMATNALTAVQTGGIAAIPAIANALNIESVNPSPQQLAAISQALSAISQNTNINPATAVGLVGSILSGQVPPAVGAALAAIPNLGNISTPQGLTQALAALQPVLGNLPAAQLGGVINQVMALASNPALAGILSTAAGAAQLAQQLSTLFPGLAATFGGQLTGQIQAAAMQLLQAAGLDGGVANAIINGLLGGTAGGALVTQLVNTVVQPRNLTCAVVGSCCGACSIEIPRDYQEVRDHVSSQFIVHQQWFLTIYWLENILPALMLMAEQLTVAGVHQVQAIGTLLDAKHQLETQRLFQELTAQAHKDYQPSEGMCTFGTFTKSLIDSERRSDVTQLALSQRMNQRQTLSGLNLAQEGPNSDFLSRLAVYRTTYCNVADNTNGLAQFCPAVASPAARRNIDIDYTRNIESRLTLDLLNIYPDTPVLTNDEADLFALSANLFSHNVAPKIMPELLGVSDGRVRLTGAERYMDLRAIFAKRSVAQNSFAAITSMRAAGDAKSAPYTKRLIYELGITNPLEIDLYLGVNPSYFAQMEILTKKLYQNPTFYTELYDKPSNVERKGAALQAIGLMQDRDLFNSLLRSEAVLSVLLETMLEKEQEKVVNAGKKMYSAGGSNQ